MLQGRRFGSRTGRLGWLALAASGSLDGERIFGGEGDRSRQEEQPNHHERRQHARHACAF
jgi:hypothetical protein